RRNRIVIVLSAPGKSPSRASHGPGADPERGDQQVALAKLFGLHRQKTTAYFAFFCFCWPTRILKCFCWASWCAFQSKRLAASERYALTSIFFGRTAMSVAVMAPSGLVIR